MLDLIPFEIDDWFGPKDREGPRIIGRDNRPKFIEGRRIIGMDNGILGIDPFIRNPLMPGNGRGLLSPSLFPGLTSGTRPIDGSNANRVLDDYLDGLKGAGIGAALIDQYRFRLANRNMSGGEAETILKNLSLRNPPFYGVGLQGGGAGVTHLALDGNPPIGKEAAEAAIKNVEVEITKGAPTRHVTYEELLRKHLDDLRGEQKALEQKYLKSITERLDLSPNGNSKARANARNLARKEIERRAYDAATKEIATAHSNKLTIIKFKDGSTSVAVPKEMSQYVRLKDGNAGIEAFLKKLRGVLPEINETERAAVESALKRGDAAKAKPAPQSNIRYGFRVAGKIIAVAGLAMDTIDIVTAEDTYREVCKKVGAWASAIGASTAIGWATSGLQAIPGIGQVAHVGLIIGAGAVGYFAGEYVVEKVYDAIVTREASYSD